MIVLHVCLDSECEAGGGGSEWQFQLDTIIEQPLDPLVLDTRGYD